jgi:hypothetical protein
MGNCRFSIFVGEGFHQCLQCCVGVHDSALLLGFTTKDTTETTKAASDSTTGASAKTLTGVFSGIGANEAEFPDESIGLLGSVHDQSLI